MTNQPKPEHQETPLREGYQPKTQPPQPGSGVKGGYQPTTSEAKPVKPPPKNP